jgi:signal transduction histidine kinase
LEVVRADGSHRWCLARGQRGWDDHTGTYHLHGAVQDITERKLVEQQLRANNAALEQRADQLRTLAAQLTLTEHHERQQLAIALHDNLQQSLNVAKLRVDMVRQAATPAEAAEDLAETDRALGEAIEASRLITSDLFPPVPRDSPLSELLEWLQEYLAHKHHLLVTVHADPQAQPEAQEVGILLFQSVRELLINVVKHAGVQVAEVTLSRLEGDRVQIVVRDCGKGFDPARAPKPGTKGGFGLFSIRERLELMGGSFAIASDSSRGTQVTLTAPIRIAPNAQYHA